MARYALISRSRCRDTQNIEFNYCFQKLGKNAQLDVQLKVVWLMLWGLAAPTHHHLVCVLSDDDDLWRRHSPPNVFVLLIIS